MVPWQPFSAQPARMRAASGQRSQSVLSAAKCILLLPPLLQNKLDLMVENALKSLTSNGVILQRDAWISEAEMCERVQPQPAVGTCRAIVKCVHALNVDAQVRCWCVDAAGDEGGGPSNRAACLPASEVD